MSENYQNFNTPIPQSQPVVSTDSNGLGIAGFILSVIGLFTGWIPFLGWVIWLMGLVLSFAGVFRKPRGLAIAGLVISFIGILLLLFIFGAFITAAAFSNAFIH